MVPVQRTSGYPYEVNDPDTGLRVRIKKHVLWHSEHEDNDAYSVFQVCSPTQPESNQCDSGQGHTPTPPSPSVPETGGLGLLLQLAEGLAGWVRREARQLGRGGSFSEGLEQATRHDPPPISSWSMGPWAPGPLAEGRLAWAAPGWIRGRLAADGCRWRSLRCLPAPPLAVAAVQRELVLGWLSSPRLVAPVQLGQPFRVPSWSEEPHVGRQCGGVRPATRHRSGFLPGALRHRTRVCSPTQPESNQCDSGQVRLISGTKEVPVTVPDTITTWETEAFCLSQQGFGLAPPKELVVFQPFFLELSLPYSIIRGENLELKATRDMCLFSSAFSSDYTLTPLAEDQQASCLCAQGRRTHSWKLTPTALTEGPVNVTMIAEAVSSHTSCDNEIVNVPERLHRCGHAFSHREEGTEQTKTYNVLLCPKGDILGRALKNLDGLLRMPYGCGEQNMALLAPNIYILEYLTNTQQITPEIKARATNFLTSVYVSYVNLLKLCYQRQLNYQHSGGAYSTFGTGSGNTWLTAFVLRSFVKAKSFIYIDPTVIANAKSWLESKQQDDGCFEKNHRKALVIRATRTPRYTLAGDMETRTLLLEHLDKVATQEGGNLYWSQSSEKSMSLSVEISSYVLLATLSATPTTADLGYASRIVRWLTSQQNSYGGFSSTQDPVVALQALALYSTLVFSPEGTVDVQFPSGQMTFEVNQDNKLLYQERALKDVTGKRSVEVKGTACASMQIKVTPEAECNTNQLRPKLTLRLQSTYVGKEDSTNMVMVDIKLLSGFVPDSESLRELKSALLVDCVEHNDDHVIIYLKPVSTPTCTRNTYHYEI
ncbi:Alpha-1-macroglobulin [Merluccius polli]|uniref:Alpha-1-macroglobulin n=1 Tax=Merluccius polli TaxID=89951 RepID=A0AA47MJ96_MERPO|nr:Alpha-1-macroglobulin [Merluccius polli]